MNLHVTTYPENSIQGEASLPKAVNPPETLETTDHRPIGSIRNSVLHSSLSNKLRRNHSLGQHTSPLVQHRSSLVHKLRRSHSLDPTHWRPQRRQRKWQQKVS